MANKPNVTSMSPAQIALTMGTLYRTLQIMADTIDRDATLLQVLAYTRVAAAGEAGMDMGALQKELKVSSATITRVVQALGEIHYSKEKKGYNVIDRQQNEANLRLRVLKMTSKGEKAAEKLAESITTGTGKPK